MAIHPELCKFYASQSWIDFRLVIISERGNQCQCCGDTIIDQRAIILHHKIELTPENVYDLFIAFGKENIELVCFNCHNKIHRRFGHESHAVYLVFGPPCAGKTAYVMQHMSRGDVVVDIDRIYSALSLLPVYDKPDNLRFNVFNVRDMLLDNIKTRAGKWFDAWVIGGYPESYKREQLQRDLGAQLIYCSATKEQCISRAVSNGGRPDVWTRYIDEWFDRYTPPTVIF